MRFEIYPKKKAFRWRLTTPKMCACDFIFILFFSAPGVSSHKRRISFRQLWRCRIDILIFHTSRIIDTMVHVVISLSRMISVDLESDGDSCIRSFLLRGRTLHRLNPILRHSTAIVDSPLYIRRFKFVKFKKNEVWKSKKDRYI